MDISEQFLKLGRVPTTETLNLGSELEIKIGTQAYKMICVKIEQKDLQNGSMDLIYSLKHLPD